jgi:hypothetical protein
VSFSRSVRPHVQSLGIRLLVVASAATLGAVGSVPGTSGPTRAYATASCTTPPAGLVSLWSGEGSGADAQGLNNAIVEGALTYVPGKHGNAFNFDGVDDGLLIPASPSLQLPNAFTLEFWFNFPFDVVPGSAGFTRGTQFLIRRYSDGFDGLGIQNGGGDLELGQQYPRLYSTTKSWLADTWNHTAMTYDAGTYRLYVNGVLETTLYRPDPLFGDLEDMYVSHATATPYNPETWYQQRLDEIAVYNRALTADEVAGRAGICPPADATPPTITITTPAATNYLLNQTTTADFTCADTGSGLASCTGPAPSGSPIDTTSVGAHTFTINAADNAGNTATKSVGYTVIYKICLLYDPSKVHRKGSTIPIKIQVCDTADANASASSIALTAHSITQTSTSTSGPVEDSGNANPDNNFRYDPALGATGGYIYNLSTKDLTTGSYTLNFTVGANPARYTVPFQVQ